MKWSNQGQEIRESKSGFSEYDACEPSDHLVVSEQSREDRFSILCLFHKREPGFSLKHGEVRVVLDGSKSFSVCVPV